MFEGIWDRQKRRGERMLRAAFDVPDEQFERLIREKLKDERTCDALLEAMRTALDAMSDDVMPAIGALIRKYEKEGRNADGFFRGCCRLLQDLSSEEYASLQRIVKGVSELFADSRDSMLRERPVRLNCDYWRTGNDHKEGNHGGIRVGEGISTDVPNVPREIAERLFHVLRTNGLASSVPPSLGKPSVDPNGRFRPLEYSKQSQSAVVLPPDVASALVCVIPTP